MRARILLDDFALAPTPVSPRRAALRHSKARRTRTALIAEPSLLLLDEPASGLSNVEMDDLAAMIRGLSPRMGVLLVEHHMDLVMSVCDV